MWMVNRVLRALVILLAVFLCSCSVAASRTYMTARVLSASESSYPFLEEALPLQGAVPLLKVLGLLEARGFVKRYPNPSLLEGANFPASGTSSVRSGVTAIENVQGWTFDPGTRAFVVAVATHTADAPDAFGRAAPGLERVSLDARASVSVSFRFRSVGGGISSTDFGPSVTLQEFSGSAPEGVRTSWNSTQERSYFEGVQSPQGVSGVVVNTERKTVSSGLQFESLAARLPGGLFRLDGTLQISSFSGSGLDRTLVSMPCQVDGPRGQWVRLMRLRGADANLSIIFKGFKVSGGLNVNAVDLEVRVE